MYELGLIETEMKDTLDKCYEEHSTVTTTLEAEAILLEESLKKLTQEHRENEAALRKKKCKLATEVKAWVTRYDEEMVKKEDEISIIRKKFEKEKKKCFQLREYFQKVRWTKTIAKTRPDFIARLTKSASALNKKNASWKLFVTKSAKLKM